MKAIAMLFVATIVLTACKNDDHKSPHDQKGRAEQEVDNPAEVQEQALKATSPESATQENVQRIAPPKPKTAGSFDFSECESMFGSGTDDFRSCVQAKYPNMKFVK